MLREIRCENKKHAILIDENTIEVKCNSRFCGAGQGVVVLHRIDIRNDSVVRTIKFKSPQERT